MTDTEDAFTLDGDWLASPEGQAKGRAWMLDQTVDRWAGAVSTPFDGCCCGSSHSFDYTPARAREIAAHLVALADRAEGKSTITGEAP